MKYFFFFFLENRILHFLQIVSYGDNLHEVSNPSFWEKQEKISSVCHLLNLNIINTFGKKNINTFGLKKAPLLALCSIMQLDQDLCFVSVDSVVSRLARYKLVQVITIHIEITTFKGGNKKLLNLQSITLMGSVRHYSNRNDHFQRW